MPKDEPEILKSIVLRFNDCINSRDLKGLDELMTEDHPFVDSAENNIIGKENCISAWHGFFSSFPDYQNIFEKVIYDSTIIKVLGISLCSDPHLQGKAIWTAKTRSNKVSEWRVYEDSIATRQQLILDIQ